MIQLNDVAFQYGSTGFRLSVTGLSLETGSTTALVGPSGSGKSTLLGLLSGILTPQHGSIRLAETEVASLDDAGRRAFRNSRIGMIFQELELLDYLNVRENILLPFLINPSVRMMDDARSSADDLAERLGIGGLLKRRIGQISQGERQRVAICRALVMQPDLLLADEPTGNLDPNTSQRTIDLLRELAGPEGATLVVATHDVAILDRFDRVLDLAQAEEIEIHPVTPQREISS